MTLHLRSQLHIPLRHHPFRLLLQQFLLSRPAGCVLTTSVSQLNQLLWIQLLLVSQFLWGEVLLVAFLGIKWRSDRYRCDRLSRARWLYILHSVSQLFCVRIYILDFPVHFLYKERPLRSLSRVMLIETWEISIMMTSTQCWWCFSIDPWILQILQLWSSFSLFRVFVNLLNGK